MLPRLPRPRARLLRFPRFRIGRYHRLHPRTGVAFIRAVGVFVTLWQSSCAVVPLPLRLGAFVAWTLGLDRDSPLSSAPGDLLDSSSAPAHPRCWRRARRQPHRFPMGIWLRRCVRRFLLVQIASPPSTSGLVFCLRWRAVHAGRGGRAACWQVRWIGSPFSPWCRSQRACRVAAAVAGQVIWMLLYRWLRGAAVAAPGMEMRFERMDA